LVRGPVEEQIKVAEEVMSKRLELRKPLELYTMVLQAQRQLEGEYAKGTTLNWSDKSVIDDLQKHARSSKRPIASFLDPTKFNEKALFPVCEQVVGGLIKKGVSEEGLKKFLDELRMKKISVHGLIGAALREDGELFEKYGEQFDVRPAILLFIVTTLIQPCMEEIVRKVDSSFLEGWWRAPCPICGRRPVVAKLKSRKRYLTCMLCGAEYLADRFLCVHCDNVDPYTLKFLTPEGRPELRIDYCEKCKHYLKVIDNDKLKTPIPSGLEDIMTISLDLMAKDAGLVRF